MYTDRMRGVRISMPVMPFQQKRLVPPPTWTVQSEGSLYAPLSLEEQFGPDYFVVPMFLDPAHFGGAVEYCDDVESRYENAITLQEEKGVVSGEIRRPFDLVRLKTREWAFQKEYRFSLFVLPSIPVPEDGPGSEAFSPALANHLVNALWRGIAPRIDFLDVDLSDQALRELEVTVGPLCSVGTTLTVRALLGTYAPQARLKASRLTGDIRAKSG
jgi:hypothetical protein